MTLATHLRVLDPVPAAEMWAEARRIMGVPTDFPYERGHFTGFDRSVNPPTRLPYAEFDDRGVSRFSHELGVGFPALLQMEFCLERPVDDLAMASPDADEEEREWLEKQPRPWFVELGWDTGYGYSDGGASCSDLHAHFVAEMGRWLDERGRRWAFSCEFTGEWFTGVENVDKVSGDYRRNADALGADPERGRAGAEATMAAWRRERGAA